MIALEPSLPQIVSTRPRLDHPVHIPLPIETERLLVRPFDPDRDSAEMLAVYGDPEVMRYIPGGALSKIEAVRAALEHHLRVQQIRASAVGPWWSVRAST